MSGFREVMPIVGPKVMINWRGLLATFLPEEVSEETGRPWTLIVSVVTTATLIPVWRGEWNLRSNRFPIQDFAMVIVMMFASYHNHIHGAALLLVPGMAVAAQRRLPHFLPVILLLGLYVPLPLFFVTGSAICVA